METIAVTLDQIKNKFCVVCGAAFGVSRAGKLYCSSKCKQFAFYHSEEIKALRTAKSGMHDSTITLLLKEFEAYSSIVKKMNDLKNLRLRASSTYSVFEPCHAQQMEKLEKGMPEYLQKIKLPKLTIEKWSYLKILYPYLRKDDFLKMISSFDNQFWENLNYSDVRKERRNPIMASFQNHLEKIAIGKIKFI